MTPNLNYLEKYFYKKTKYKMLPFLIISQAKVFITKKALNHLQYHLHICSTFLMNILFTYEHNKKLTNTKCSKSCNMYSYCSL
jgi:hypothetical protein